MTADERHQAIVVAGVEEFASGGLVGASTVAIARRAGVSQPYVVQLFGTKKELFLAVVRRCFGRTQRTFEKAARRYELGTLVGCNSILDAMGASYMEFLADRTLLLVQLQAYAACADPEVQHVVREEFGRLHRRVDEMSEASSEEVQRFFAEGMPLNVAAAVKLKGEPKTWTLDALDGVV